MRTVFTHEIFDHAISYAEYNEGLYLYRALSGLFRIKLFLLVLGVLERVVGFILAINIPIYSDFILLLVRNLPGRPYLLGCYLRAVYYSFKFNHLGQNVVIEEGVIFSNPKGVIIGDMVLIDRYVLIASMNTTIGTKAHIAPFVDVTGGGDLVIEDYSGLAHGACVITSTESMNEGYKTSGPMVPREKRQVTKGSVIIRKDAFVSSGVTLLTNTVVEEGVVLAANIVGPKRTEPWSYYSMCDGTGRLVKAKRVRSRPGGDST